jgi:hypothetical protein
MPKKQKTDPQYSWASVFVLESILFVADISLLGGIKEQIADRCNQSVDTKGNNREENVRQSSRRITLRFQRGVVDDNASDPTQEKGQQKTNEIVVIHYRSPFFKLCSFHRAQHNYTPFIDNCQ